MLCSVFAVRAVPVVVDAMSVKPLRFAQVPQDMLFAEMKGTIYGRPFELSPMTQDKPGTCLCSCVCSPNCGGRLVFRQVPAGRAADSQAGAHGAARIAAYACSPSILFASC